MPSKRARMYEPTRRWKYVAKLSPFVVREVNQRPLDAAARFDRPAWFAEDARDRGDEPEDLLAMAAPRPGLAKGAISGGLPYKGGTF